MVLEQRGEFSQASSVYDEVLAENPANNLVSKRQVCILLAQAKTAEAIVKLNQLLKTFPMDKASWQQLATLHLSKSNFRQAAFCYEELVLLNPLNFWFHSRLAEIYMTLGGFANTKAARKHLAQSLDLNPNNNIRALMSLALCTSTLRTMKQVKSNADEAKLNQRLFTFADQSIRSFYEKSDAPTSVKDIVYENLIQMASA